LPAPVPPPVDPEPPPPAIAPVPDWLVCDLSQDDRSAQFACEGWENCISIGRPMHAFCKLAGCIVVDSCDHCAYTHGVLPLPPIPTPADGS